MQLARRSGAVTSRDIARIAGVSQSTVSRVLNNDPRVLPMTRERVLRACQQTGYQPNSAARSMRTGRTGVIGVVLSHITNPFHSHLLQTAAEEIASVGHEMIVWYTEGGARSVAEEAVKQHRVDGLIFTTADRDTALLSAAVSSNVPLVLVHRTVERIQCDQVTGGDRSGGRRAADYLLRHNRAQVGVIAGNRRISTLRDREAGFRAPFTTSKESGNSTSSIRVDSYTHQQGYDAALRLLEQDSHLAAIFAVNDMLALGALDAVRAHGVRVPEDLWIIGYDDVEMAAWPAFDLTTVREPTSQMISAAVELLRRRIDAPTTPVRHLAFDGDLIIRGTTGHAD